MKFPVIALEEKSPKVDSVIENHVRHNKSL